MATPPRTLGSGAANAPGRDPRRTDSRTVEEELDSFDEDLHEGDRAGQHAGVHVPREYTAYDVKDLHEAMPGYTDAELKVIPVLAHGERLEQGAVYLDLHNRQGGPFVAQGSDLAEDPHLYVPKARCDYVLWNKLTGEPEQR